jgi:CRISPR-associated protein Cas1
MLNEVTYCERLFYLEWVQGEWDANAFTAEGTAVHEGVDKPGVTARRSRTSREGAGEAAERPFRARSVG